MISVCQQILIILTPVALAYSLGRMVSTLNHAPNSWTAVLPWIFALLFIHLANQSFILNSWKDYVYQKKLEEAFDEPILDKISKLPLSRFEDAATHDLISRTIQPSKRLPSIIEDVLYSIGAWLTMASLILFIGVFFWWLAALLVLVAFIVARVESRIGQRMQQFDRQWNPAVREQNYAGQLITGRESVLEAKLFGLIPEWKIRWEGWFHKTSRARTKFDFAVMVPDAVLSLPRAGLLLASIAIMGWQMQGSGADLGAFAGSLTALLSLFSSMDNTAFYARNLGQGGEYVHELRTLLALPEEEAPKYKDLPIDPAEELHIEFRNVTFTYPGAEAPSLRDVSFILRSGERLALVGPNGSGKSTLVKLLLGLYEPDQGEILVNGFSVREYDRSSLSRMMSVVFQDYMTYSLTVRENIGIGQLDLMHEDEHLRQAAEQAQVLPLINELPAGLDTPLGKLTAGSRDLSGGQWQKMAIARGLARESQFIIFDEPTASLDPVAESELYEQIHQLLQGRTAILVTHRLGSVKICDRILVLEEGQVRETGSHDALLSRTGLYSEMYAAQASWYKEGSA